MLGHAQTWYAIMLHVVWYSLGAAACAPYRYQSRSNSFCFVRLFLIITQISAKPSVLWRCRLGARKGIRPVKIEWWGVGVAICLERGADCLHMVQLMPLMPLSLASFKSRLVLPFLYRLSWKKKLLNGRSSNSSRRRPQISVVDDMTHLRYPAA